MGGLPEEEHAANIGHICLAQVLANMPVEAEDEEGVDSFIEQPGAQVGGRHVVVLGPVPKQDPEGIPKGSLCCCTGLLCLQPMMITSLKASGAIQKDGQVVEKRTCSNIQTCMASILRLEQRHGVNVASRLAKALSIE